MVIINLINQMSGQKKYQICCGNSYDDFFDGQGRLSSNLQEGGNIYNFNSSAETMTNSIQKHIILGQDESHGISSQIYCLTIRPQDYVSQIILYAFKMAQEERLKGQMIKRDKNIEVNKSKKKKSESLNEEDNLGSKTSQISDRNQQGRSIPTHIRSKIKTFLKKHNQQQTFSQFLRKNNIQKNSQLIIIYFYLFLLMQKVSEDEIRSCLDQIYANLKKKEVKIGSKQKKESNELIKINCHIQMITYLISLTWNKCYKQMLDLDYVLSISKSLYKGRQKNVPSRQFEKYQKIYRHILQCNEESMIMSQDMFLYNSNEL